ncbi:MAG: YbaN family protein [Armatimonadetes bacterium]|nr:YbaN family protein [Armatimonadota bacterium]
MTPIKIFYNVLGTFFVGVGVAGIFLPLLPTTPFLLLASACYVRGSKRLHDWLMNHRHLGPYIRNIKERRGMPMRAKVITLGFLWVSIGFSIYSIGRWTATVALICTATCTTTYLLRMKTLPKEALTNPDQQKELAAAPQPE